MKFLANYIMQGRMQAIIVASSLALLSLIITPLSIVSSASIALVTLRQGSKEGAYTLAFACIATATLGFIILGSFSFPLTYALTLWLPIWVIAIVLREGRHLFLAIEIAVFIAGLGIIAAYLYQPELGSFWKHLFNDFLEPIVIQSRPDLSTEDIQRSLEQFYHSILTGLMALLYAFILLSGLFLARWWQAVLYNPGGFKKEYMSLQGNNVLGITTLIVFSLSWLVSGAISEMCSNLMVVLVTLYALLGVIVLHGFFANLKLKRFLVPFLYITMILIPHMVFPAAIIGFTDTWLNLRNKISNQPSS